MKTVDRKDWQANPKEIKTNLVQVWTTSGTMSTARCPRPDARELVAQCKAFVMTDQAIGMCEGLTPPADSTQRVAYSR